MGRRVVTHDGEKHHLKLNADRGDGTVHPRLESASCLSSNRSLNDSDGECDCDRSDGDVRHPRSKAIGGMPEHHADGGDEEHGDSDRSRRRQTGEPDSHCEPIVGRRTASP